MSDTITNRDFQRHIAKYLKTPGIYYLKGVKVTIELSDESVRQKEINQLKEGVRQKVSDKPSDIKIDAVSSDKGKISLTTQINTGAVIGMRLGRAEFLSKHGCGCKKTEKVLCPVHSRV